MWIIVIVPSQSGCLEGFPVVQLGKNLPAMRETWVPSLDLKEPLEKGKATQSSILTWRIPKDCIVHGVSKSWTQLSDFHFHIQYNLENRSSSSQEEFTSILFKLQFMCVRNC